MKKVFLLLTVFAISATTAMSQGYEIGDKATDFSLTNVDGKTVSMSDFKDAKGFIVIFSCNHCPYVVAYEDRMIDLHKTYAPKGYPVIAINSNDPEVQPQDSYEKMIERANEKNFPFVYLFDKGQKIYPQYGATRTPHVFLLNKEGEDLIVKYIGAIDDNYKDANAVKENYLANAVDALLKGKNPEVKETKAIGCSIKVKK
ncbi:MAG: thioredoxin family protein [Bacteroidota bacterium]